MVNAQERIGELGWLKAKLEKQLQDKDDEILGMREQVKADLEMTAELKKELPQAEYEAKEESLYRKQAKTHVST